MPFPSLGSSWIPADGRAPTLEEAGVSRAGGAAFGPVSKDDLRLSYAN